MTYYLDISNMNGAVGFIAGEGETIILTGTEIHQEPEKYRALGEPYAKEKDIHFWYGEEGPEEPVYTVPGIELAGYDSRGGYLASMNDQWIYIDSQKNCFRLPETENVLLLPNDWRDRLEPMEPVHFFPSREEAQKVFPIQDACEVFKNLPDLM